MVITSASVNSMLIVSDGSFMESYFVEHCKSSHDIRLLHVEDLAHVKSLSRRYATIIYCPVVSSSADNISHISRLCGIMDATSTPYNFIFISSYEVYGMHLPNGVVVTESMTPQPDTPFGRDMLACEHHLDKWSEGKDVCLTILRPGEIVGNAMTGRIRKMADMIENGLYMHLPGYDGTIPLIHAEDLAATATCLCGHNGIFNLADGHAHRRTEVAEALAHRLNDKRILTVPRRVVALMKLLSPIIKPLENLLSISSRETALSVAAVAELSAGRFNPRNVVEYLNGDF